MPPKEQLTRLLSSSKSETSLDDDFSEAPALAATRHLLLPNGSIVGSEVSQVLEPLYDTFVAAMPSSPRPALASIDGRRAISHSQISYFVHQVGHVLHAFGIGRRHRVALVLPNGPELALAIVSISHWASCVPLSATSAISELEADISRCGAHIVIGPYSGEIHRESNSGSDDRFRILENHEMDWKHFACIEESARNLDIPFVGLVPSPYEAGIFRLVPTNLSHPLRYDDHSIVINRVRHDALSVESNKKNDEALVLFTSGTTGNKKLVPHRLGDLLCAATTIALSWDLTTADVNCNLMPLFHVGGIVRQVFSPILSGGCVICCPSFDPSIFWALLAKRSFTWYYAAPTMHQMILQTHEPDVCKSPRLRMIANAAGGLLPSLAVQLRDKFQANVLPSYGMTECMPISSPPSNYQLEKPGTSGVAVGPEICIFNVANMTPCAFEVEGSICVRGDPCFKGYGRLSTEPGSDLPQTFLQDGWFNTGDLGYLDQDGYLYITGRTKEVINRGGEIISPMEVEEAVMGHPDVAACAAFSAKHKVLQEVVGLVLVMKAGRPRLDLALVHSFLGDRLAAPKWPQCLVFIDGLPKSHTNKLLRVKLGERFGLPELTDEMLPIERLFEGICPPQGTGLDVPIPVSHVKVSTSETQRLLEKALHEDDLSNQHNREILVINNANRKGSMVCYLFNINVHVAIATAKKVLDAYTVPTHFVQLDQPLKSTMDLPIPQTKDAVISILQSVDCTKTIDPLVGSIQSLFIQLLKLDFNPLADANFFHLGGSSLLASQLASKIRIHFKVSCSGADIFHHSSCNDLAKLIHKRSSTSDDSTVTSDTSCSQDTNSDTEVQSIDGQGAPFAAKRLPLESSFLASIFQLFPMFFVFPLFQVTRYMLFFSMLLWSVEVVPGERDLGTFILAYLTFHLIWVTFTPLVFVAIKWIVIGRYTEGRYPIWGSYYLKWWFVDVCRKLFLRGIWGSNETFLNFYYRMLGAKIGKGAKISLEADIAEFDLVAVGRNAAVEMCTLRAFGVDNGAMILGKVRVGNDSSVGVRSVVAPYTSVPDGSHLGPLTTSYDTKALHNKHARVNRRCLPEPNLCMQLFVGAPIGFLVNCFGQIPPMFMLWCMLRYKVDINEEFQSATDLMKWLCDPRRIPFYLGIRVLRAILSPIFYMAGAIVVKRCLIGKFKPGPTRELSQWQLLRHHLSATLFSRKKIQNVIDIIGRHYELVSCLYRLLGAKIGKRVFWPGHQPVFSGEFDLLEIGDDVVFGSRSLIFCRSIDSCEKVILCAGANVADNCLVLPGSIVGKNAVLGSNSLCPEGWFLPEGSVWFGSKGSEPVCLEKGPESGSGRRKNSLSIDPSKLSMKGDETTLRPFGKAFYKRDAAYFVYPLSWIITVTFVVKILIASFHALPLLLSLQGAATLLFGGSVFHRDYVQNQHSFVAIYAAVVFVFFIINIFRVFLWFVIEMSAKYSILGQRQEGRYNYDTHDYAQRWELYQLIAKIRKLSRFNFLDFLSGTPYIALYFRALGGQIGKNCCLYPTGADPFMPEPDLIYMGDNCVVDCASLVCHLNTRGNFELVRIVLESDCTLRARSRVQQGVYMESGSQLLEKSVAMTGEIIESKSVWLGCPAVSWFQQSDVVVSQGDGDESFDSAETSRLLQSQVSRYNL
jgi:acyl-coenzyme A synthetase/AMP-(fatty) acid ligase/acetyltransferase-like isoleucine patch superfamily enzyme